VLTKIFSVVPAEKILVNFKNNNGLNIAMEFLAPQTLLQADAILVTTMTREVGELEASLGASVVELVLDV